uniref:OTU domain-containing protein n=1 Tax=Chromera velia CCMP2878 TaxID=1169474 RepID=A0A0G4FM65_9ALVE|eukprot:Cvel_3511.t1-p1 / transcript=Cvel_3511.t1 / gene=Cvel_3511 / organism=Chromera_velia_CCMP2878 / gene_product=hypothetical protein / transcript_product=hypothetical protein / location=Cvel_scaffold142:39187-43541(-) / protein_length=274 / sequence_SO=supercontig / SO=protein_coding / is_pseudo=false
MGQHVSTACTCVKGTLTCAQTENRMKKKRGKAVHDSKARKPQGPSQLEIRERKKQKTKDTRKEADDKRDDDGALPSACGVPLDSCEVASCNSSQSWSSSKQEKEGSSADGQPEARAQNDPHNAPNVQWYLVDWEEADGNCLPRAIGRILGLTHREVRKIMCAILKSTPWDELGVPGVDWHDPNLARMQLELADNVTVGSPEAYVKYMKKDGKYGGEVELRALAFRYRVCIDVWDLKPDGVLRATYIRPPEAPQGGLGTRRKRGGSCAGASTTTI